MATRYNYTGGIVTDGLVLHLDAAKRDSYPGSGTTIYDISQSRITGSLMNGASFSGTSKDASIELDGTNDYIDFGNQSLIEDDFCISIWIKRDSGKEHYYFTTGYNSAGSILLFSDGNWLNSAATDGRFSSYPAGNIGEIFNMTVTRTNGVAKAYDNGTLVSTLNYSGSIAQNTRYILGWAIPRNKSTAYHEGSFYQMQMYNRGLSADEISQNFNALRGRYGI